MKSNTGTKTDEVSTAIILPKDKSGNITSIDMSELTMWSWNVNGIRAIVKKNRIQEFFEKVNPTILAI